MCWDPALAISMRPPGVTRPMSIVTNMPRTMRSFSVVFNLAMASAGLVAAAKTNCIALSVWAMRSEAAMPLPETSPMAK